MRLRSLVCYFRSAILDIHKLNISTLYSDLATKKPLRNGFTKMLNVKKNIWLKGLKLFSCLDPRKVIWGLIRPETYSKVF